MVIKKQNRSYSRDLKLAALERMERGENIGALAQELGICVSRLYEWRKIYQLYGDVSLRVIACPPGRKILVAPSDVLEDAEYGSVGAESGGLAGLAAAKRRITELERKIGQQELDIDFFGKPCGVSGRNAA